MKSTDTLTANAIIPKKFHHIALNVTDLLYSVRFYMSVLGLTLVESDDNRARLHFGTAELCLFRSPLDDTIDPSIKKNDVGGQLNHIAIEIETGALPLLFDRIKQHNIPITFGPVRRRSGDSLYFLDPDGNKIELISPHQ
jgi:catechol-2,3-dioxygenase